MLTRLAPTPSGYLHLGNAVNFVLTWLAARQRGGRILLRIDDIDADRKRPEYVADIFKTLDWLGLDYDLGPTGPNDFEAHWSQRHRMARYEATLGTLADLGAVYGCGLSRKQLAAYGGAYPAAGRTQALPLTATDVSWRFRVGEADASGLVRDVVVRRRDGLPAYQIASLTDDTDFGVTHLIRGQDLAESTYLQAQLAAQLGWSTFLEAQVWHHPILTENGQKLSKSAGSGATGPASIRAMRAAGVGPERVFRAVGALLRESLNVPIEFSYSLAGLLAQNPIPDAFFATVQTVK